MSELSRRSFMELLPKAAAVLAGGSAILALLPVPAQSLSPFDFYVDFRLEQGSRWYTQGLVSYECFLNAVLPSHKGYKLVKFEWRKLNREGNA